MSRSGIQSREQASPATQGSSTLHVSQGQSVEQVAHQSGFHWSTVWDHPDNAELRRRREDRNILLPGDHLVVPALRHRSQTGATGSHHRFRRLGLPSRLKLRFLDDAGQPLANAAYVCTVDSAIHQGETNSVGILELRVSPSASVARVTLLPGTDHAREFHILIGHLDPCDTPSGVEQRLRNLGIAPAEMDENADLRSSLLRFQDLHHLPKSGELDRSTIEKLRDLHTS